MPSKAKITLGFSDKRTINRFKRKAALRGYKPAELVAELESQLLDEPELIEKVQIRMKPA